MVVIIGLIISILSLALATYTYFKHDAVIKRQSFLLNSYQLEKVENERENSQRAVIEGNIIKGDKGKRTLKIYNKGDALARDVKVHFPDNPGLLHDDDLFPIDIKPKHSVDIILWLLKGSPGKTKISFEWSDDFSHNNTDHQTIQF